MQEMEDVYKQHEVNLKTAHKMVLKESIEKDAPMTAEISFIYQTDENKFYKSTTIIFARYLEEHRTFTTEQEAFDNEISLDEFLDHLNTFKHEDERAAKEVKRKRGRPRTRPVK